MTKKSCLFCEVRPADSQEHTWSDWVLRYWQDVISQIGNVKLPVEFSYSNVPAGIERSWLGRSTVGDFCVHCNTGWMSALDYEASHILKPMIIGKPHILDQRDQRLLARWGLLKVLVFGCMDPARPVPRYRYRQFYRQGVKSCVVHLMTTDAVVTAEAEIQKLVAVDVPGGPIETFRGLLKMGHVVMQVMGDMPHRLGLRTALPHELERRFLAVWPPGSRPRSWPPPIALGLEDLKRLAYDPFLAEAGDRP